MDHCIYIYPHFILVVVLFYLHRLKKIDFTYIQNKKMTLILKHEIYFKTTI